MMKRRIGRLLITMILLCVMAVGCGNEEIESIDYPTEAVQNTEDTSSATENGSETTKLRYDVTDSKGAVCYRVDADVLTPGDGELAVIEIDTAPVMDEAVSNLFKSIFDTDTMNTVFAPQIADSDYIVKRIGVLENRKAEGTDTKAVQEEIDQLQKILNKGDFDDRYTVSVPEAPTPIDLSEYFEATYGEPVFARVCAADGYIDGELYRAEYIEYNNSYVVRIFRPEFYYYRGDSYYLLGEIDENGYEEDNEFKSATKTAELFLSKMFPNIQGYTGIYKLNVFGGMDKKNVAHAYDKSGFLFLTSPTSYGACHPANAYNDFYSDRLSETGYTCYLDEIMYLKSLQDNVDLVIHTMKNSDGSYATGYESASVAIDEKGVFEMTFCNLTNTKNVNATNPDLLPFEEIDTRAQNYLLHKADNSDTKEDNETINKVELGMARVISEGHTYMVPAWYYMQEINETSQQLPKPAVCINAMDGSIIDVARGGITEEF